MKFGDQTWTHAEYFTESCRFAQLFLSRRPPEPAPFHVGVLLDNIPEHLFAFGGAALAGATVVGLNHTRPPEGLLHDAAHTDVGLMISEPGHAEHLAGWSGELLVVGESLGDALATVSADDPGLDPDVDTRWALIFTSGTSDAPKAVVCTQRRLLVTGNRLSMILGVGPDDCGYVCMPLFHSNAVMVGWAPSVIHGASVGLARKFSVSAFLSDVRRYGCTWFGYTGKPLSYLVASPEEPGDADNPLRIAFGNEGSSEVVEAFSKRFGVEVVDAYGATEGGIAVNRDAAPRAGALGLVTDTVKVVDDDGNELPRARFDEHGRLANADECVGEIVNVGGAGPFEGYYNNPEASERTTRFGWYWSGDLGYVDADGYLYFAGRNADWIRVGGENFPAGPIEAVIARYPDAVLAAVYGVADEQAGDQVMAALVMKDGVDFDPEVFAKWVDAQDEVSERYRPRYVRVARELPMTGTNKIVKRTLVHEKFRHDRCSDDAIYWREKGEPTYRPFTGDDEAAVQAAFEAAGRLQFWDL
ncbi:MAG: AMP-binding protein [Actinobacteria bacterium]|nr:AMP-binding protein [Actinomycetota bacterium]